jgi:hypothetical protein
MNLRRQRLAGHCCWTRLEEGEQIELYMQALRRGIAAGIAREGGTHGKSQE